jgi:hypothetical protein
MCNRHLRLLKRAIISKDKLNFYLKYTVGGFVMNQFPDSVRSLFYKRLSVDEKTQAKGIINDMKKQKIMVKEEESDISIELTSNVKFAEILKMSSRQLERYISGASPIPKKRIVKLKTLWKKYHDNHDYMEKYRVPNGFLYQDDTLLDLIKSAMDTPIEDWGNDDQQNRIREINDRIEPLRQQRDSFIEYNEQCELDALDNRLKEQLACEFDKLELLYIYKLSSHIHEYLQLDNEALYFLFNYSALNKNGKQILMESMNKYKGLNSSEAEKKQLELCEKMKSCNDSAAFEEYKQKPHMLTDEEVRKKLWNELYEEFKKLPSYSLMECFVERMPYIYEIDTDDWRLLSDYYRFGENSNYRKLLGDESEKLADDPYYQA